MAVMKEQSTNLKPTFWYEFIDIAYQNVRKTARLPGGDLDIHPDYPCFSLFRPESEYRIHLVKRIFRASPAK
jgi:hypothetical protein